MYTEGFEQWFKLNKNFTTPVNDINKATTDICRRLTQEGLEILSDNVTLVSDQMKRLSNIRKPEDYLNLTRECLTEDLNAGVATIQKMMQLSMQTIEEMTRLTGSMRDTASTIVRTAEKEKTRN